MFQNRRLSLLLAGALVVLVAADLAQARSRAWYGPDGRMKVDLDKLKADIRYDRGQWLLIVQYEVEVKRPHPAARLDLVLHLTEKKYQVIDASGRPVVIGVPLARPASVNRKGNKIYFRDVISVNLPDGLFGRPKDLRVEGRVIAVDFGQVLDRKNTSVKFDKRAPWSTPGFDHFGIARSDPFANRYGPRW